MEEILASIRRIISEDGDGKAAASSGDDVLELTQIVQDEDPPSPPPLVAEQAPAPPAPEPLQADPPAPPPPVDRLVSQGTVHTAAHRFADLARAATPDPLAGVRGGRTVEDIVIELLKPMLREWLDQNLPSIVERLVEREIRYLSRRVESE